MTTTLNKQYNLYVPSDEPRLAQPDWFEKTFRTMETNTQESVSRSRKGTCIQAGGCFGIWPEYLAKFYSKVMTFEPDPVLYECMAHNIKAKNVSAYNVALGNEYGQVAYHRKKHGAGTLAPTKAQGRDIFDVPVIALDDLALDECDTIFLDVERYEIQALEGARETIAKYKPVIQLEVHDKVADDISVYMPAIGYKEVAKAGSRDRVYVCQ